MKDEQADEKVGSGRGGTEPMASNNIYSSIVASSEVCYSLFYDYQVLALCIYDRWPIVVHISAPNTTEETREDSS